MSVEHLEADHAGRGGDARRSAGDQAAHVRAVAVVVVRFGPAPAACEVIERVGGELRTRRDTRIEDRYTRTFAGHGCSRETECRDERLPGRGARTARRIAPIGVGGDNRVCRNVQNGRVALEVAEVGAVQSNCERADARMLVDDAMAARFEPSPHGSEIGAVDANDHLDHVGVGRQIGCLPQCPIELRPVRLRRRTRIAGRGDYCGGDR